MSGRTNNVIRLAVSNPALTIREMVEIDFESIPEFVDFENNCERARAHNEKLQELFIATHLAIIVLGRSKAELIELIKSMDYNERVDAAELYRGLTRGRELVAAILEMMTAAETRVAAVLAVRRKVTHGYSIPRAPP